MDLWDLPAYFLERIPQTAHYLARQFADAMRHAALTLELRSSGMPVREPAPKLNEAIAGRKLAELAAPGSLVWRFLAPAVSRAEPGSAKYADLIRRSCGFLDAAITADTEAGGRLDRELAQRLSDTFVKSAAEVSDRNLNALWRVLDERLWTDSGGPA